MLMSDFMVSRLSGFWFQKSPIEYSLGYLVCFFWLQDIFFLAISLAVKESPTVAVRGPFCSKPKACRNRPRRIR